MSTAITIPSMGAACQYCSGNSSLVWHGGICPKIKAIVTLQPTEMTKLSNLWEFHRKDCKHDADAKIEYRSGGGIGTAVVVTCGCGKEMDITDYSSW